jgi:hypothetical protein
MQDYHGLVLDAQQHGARVVCANAPRRLVGLVGRRGESVLQEALPAASLALLPPLPLHPPSPAHK